MGIQKTGYPVFYEFKRRVLNQAKKEFEKKLKGGTFNSDITFDLEPIKKGRKVIGLGFRIKRQTFQSELPMNYTESPQIQKLVYFGVSAKDAKKLFDSKGEAAIEDALDVFTERQEAGTEIKSSGAYLKRLIEESAAKSTFDKAKESDQERKKIEVAKAAEIRAREQEIEAQEKAARSAYLEQLEADFINLPNVTQG